VLAPPGARPEVSSQFAANLFWMHEEGLAPGRSYLMKIGAQIVQASIKAIIHRVDVNTMEQTKAEGLELNEIGSCELTTNQPIVFDRYAEIRESGAFILVDRYSNQTVGAGMITQSLSVATNVHRHAMDVTQTDRSRQYGHRPAILWFTGLSGSGKSTIANLVERRLAGIGAHTYSLDGDNVRQGLNKDLGFSDSDRVENIRRVGEVAKLFVDAGTIVTASFISPFKSERETVRSLVKPTEYIEIFVDTPITVCAQRDPKGLYKKAMAGEIKNFTGIDSPYEPPVAPYIILETTEEPPEALVEKVIAHLTAKGLLSSGVGATSDFSI
jgi:bifunctional enzyme CysN/CysC